MRGYAYDRRDVTGRGLANAYAQTLGTIFSRGGEKPYEVEIFVAEIGDAVADDQIYRLTYDGQVADEHGFAVMGGAADVVAGAPARSTTPPGASLDDALRVAVAALGPQRERRPRDPGRATSRSRCSTAPAPSRASSCGCARPASVEVLGRRGVEEPAAASPEDALAGSGPRHSGQDDPADPTDQVSRGDAAPGGPGDGRAPGRAARGPARAPRAGRLQPHPRRPGTAADGAGPGLTGPCPTPGLGSAQVEPRPLRPSRRSGCR